MKIKINIKIIVLSVFVTANSVFAMEQENNQDKKASAENKEDSINSSKIIKYFKNLFGYDTQSTGIDFTNVLPKEIIQEILNFCIDNKYPKLENAEKSLTNIKIVCKKLNLIAKKLAQQKKDDFKKYDALNINLFWDLSLWYSRMNDNLVLDFINNGADVNLKNEFGVSILMKAANYRQKDVLKKLIEKGTDVNAQDKNGETALIHAVHGGSKNIVKRLIESNASVNLQDKKGNTALMYALYLRRSWEMINTLVRNSVNINLKNKEGKTALKIAKETNRPKVVKLLESKMAENMEKL